MFIFHFLLLSHAILFGGKSMARVSIPISVFLQMVPWAILFYPYYPYLIIWFHAEGTSYLSGEFPVVPYCFHGQWISVHPNMFNKKCWKERITCILITCSLLCCNRTNSSRTSEMGFLWVVSVIGFPGCTVSSGASEANLTLCPLTMLRFAWYSLWTWCLLDETKPK